MSTNPVSLEPSSTEQGNSTTSMHAIVQTSYGGADQFVLGVVSRPAIGADEVLIEVAAAGLDRGTWHLMAGLPYVMRLGFGLRRPKSPVPGLDVAGTVVAVGNEVTRFALGDEVFGIGRGAFAEYAVATENKLARMPSNLTFDEAAAVPVSGLTALQAVRDVARIEAGQQVLIVGASGGVGSFAVQVAAAQGAHVTGVCSTSKVDLVRSLGAEAVIDYRAESFAERGEMYDVILDIGGNTPLSRLRRVLASDGTLVIVGGEEGGRWIGGVDRQIRAMALSPFVGQRLTSFISKERGTDLDVLRALIEAGTITPVVERTYPLSEAPEAMRQLENGEARGKLVIAIRSTTRI
jgi:NADPH:quinone reductase-like Zn-dependent oxidoreductase